MGHFKTSFANLDVVLSGGYPEGSMVEVVGPPLSGGNSVGLAAVAACDARGGKAAVIAGGKFSREHVLGVQRQKGLLSHTLLETPESIPQALELARIHLEEGIPFVFLTGLEELPPLDSNFQEEMTLLGDLVRKKKGCLFLSTVQLRGSRRLAHGISRVLVTNPDILMNVRYLNHTYVQVRKAHNPDLKNIEVLLDFKDIFPS